MTVDEAENATKHPAPGAGCMGKRKLWQMNAIRRAPAKVQQLYKDGLIDAKLAELLGPDKDAKGYAGRKAKADRAFSAINAVLALAETLGSAG